MFPIKAWKHLICGYYQDKNWFLVVIDRQLYFWIKDEHELEHEALNAAFVVRTWLLRSAVSASGVA